jgi:large subunit ribosomal protein L22
MAGNNYAFQGMKESMARAMKKDAEMSKKVSIEICSFLRGKTTTEAKRILGRVLAKKQAVPYKRFTDGVGHRKGAGIAAGRYPQKASQIFIDLIESVEANAQAKGLSSNLKIIHLATQKPSISQHYGRHRGQFKRAHVEIVVQEMEKDAKAKDTKQKKSASIVESKTEAAKQEVKETKKEEVQEERRETANAEETKKQAPKTQKAPGTKVTEKKSAKKSAEDKQ